MKIKKILFLVVIAIIFLIGRQDIYAKEVSITSDRKDADLGDEITLTVTLDDLKSVYAYTGQLSLDSEVFEAINKSDFEELGDWSSVSFNNDNNKFGLINKSGTNGNGLFKIRLKVREDAKAGNTKIYLSNSEISDGDNTTKLDNVDVTVLITKNAVEGESIPNNKVNENVTNESKPIKVFSLLPITIVLAVLTVLTMIIVICINNLKKFDDNRKKRFKIIVGIFLFILSLSTIVLTIKCFNKSDVNDDGKKDYDDASSIMDYIIGITTEEDKDSKNNSDSDNNNNSSIFISYGENKYDYNNDGKIDTEDVADHVKDTTKNSDIILSNPSVNSRYPKKGEENYLIFEAETDPSDLEIDYVYIDGRKYSVKKNDENSYTVTIDTPEKAGIYKYKITKVALSNGKQLDKELEFEIDVLKDVPYLHNINIDEKEKSLSFELIDEDIAFKDGKIIIYNNDEKVLEESFKGNKKVTYDFIEGETYIVDILGNYDLDSNKNDSTNSFVDEKMFSHSFIFEGDYNFVLNNASITDIVQPGENPVISFTSTNTKNAQIINATINDKQYAITKTNGKDHYEIELDGADTTHGKHTVSLDSVQLNSVKSFNNNEDYKVNNLTYYVLKKNPEISDINLDANTEEGSIDVSFDVTDTDKTLSGLKAVLVDSDGNVIFSQEIDLTDVQKNGNGHKLVNLKYKANNGYADGSYTVQIVADYALGDKYTYNDTKLTEEKIDVIDDDSIKITALDVGNSLNNSSYQKLLYPTKGQKKYQVRYKIYISDDIKKMLAPSYPDAVQVAAITINGVTYNTSVESYCDETDTKFCKYTVITVPKESGPLELTVSRVQLQYDHYNGNVSKFFSVKNKSIVIDVLKDTPKIEDLKITDEDYQNGKVTFDFNVTLDKNAKDDDNSFTNGTIDLNGQSQKIERGYNSVTFDNVDKDKLFDLTFKGDYDLDTNTIEEDTESLNEYKGREIYKVKYGLYDKNNYSNIKIENGTAISKNNDNYFEKNEKIKLKFDITGIEKDSEIVPERVVIDNQEYALIKSENGYEIILNGYVNSGIKEIKITDIILNNGKGIKLENDNTFSPEVLRDIIKITDYSYEVTDSDIKIKFVSKDSDNSLVGVAKVVVTDEDGNTIYSGDYNKNIEFQRINDTLRYKVTVFADYDRDSNKIFGSDNYNEDIKIFEETISLDKKYIELKDIEDVSVYKITGTEEQSTLIDVIDRGDIEENKDDYFVEVSTRNMPSVRARIKSVTESDNHLMIELKFNYLTEENREGQIIKLDLGEIRDNNVENEIHPDIAFEKLIKDLEEDKVVTLTHDYDASVISTDKIAYVEEFSGTFNGNGYKIKNLNKPLFDKISGGKVENLVIENVTLDGNGRGALANNTKNTTIKNVLVNRVTKFTASDEPEGGLIGIADSNTTVEECGVREVHLEGGGTQQNGGLIGKTENAIIKNNYAIGVVNGYNNYTSSFIGNAQNSVITNNYVNVKISNDTSYSCDFACTYSGRSTFNGNISLNENRKQFVNQYKSLKNNYHLTDKDDNLEGIITITRDMVNSELFEKAGFDSKIWNLEGVSYSNPPKLRIENITSIFENIDGYDKNKDILYDNLMKLMPFYEKRQIIEMASSVSDNNLINERIKHIVPIDNSGNIVTYLTSDNAKKIIKLEVVFENNEKVQYSVTYDNIYDMVAFLI